MALKIFGRCKHDKYDVITWRYQNLNKENQRIIATVHCLTCGEDVEKVITDRAIMDTFAFVYDDKYAVGR